MQMFIAIVKSQKQPSSLSIGVKKTTVIHTNNRMLFSDLKKKKKNELPSHEKTWINCKYILLNETSQSEKSK